jgi:hypothetical protein
MKIGKGNYRYTLEKQMLSPNGRRRHRCNCRASASLADLVISAGDAPALQFAGAKLRFAR